MRGITLVWGYFCINAAIWTLNIAGILPNFMREPIVDPANILSMFNLDTFTVITGTVGGAVIGILTYVTRNYALGGAVLLVWIVGVIFKPVYDIFLGLPRLVEAVLPVEVWFLSQPIVAFAGFVLFIFIVEILAGRPIN